MLDQTGKGNGDEPKIVLLKLNEAHWMYLGEEFLNSMLKGNGYYPVPIKCVVFEDNFALRHFIGSGRAMTDFWGINPDIVERLRRDKQLVDVTPDAI